jgi:hypothetical protein
MNKLFQFSCLIFILVSEFVFVRSSFCQTDSTRQANIYSPRNILLFADYLFCQKDYLRAISEYEKYLSVISNDTIKFKIALSFLNMKKYEEAEAGFAGLGPSSVFFNSAQLKIAQSIFLKKDLPGLEKFYLNASSYNYSGSEMIKSIYLYSLFYEDIMLPGENDFVNSFPDSNRITIRKFYSYKENLPYRSPVLASILSTIIPGSGKIYTGNYSDGIMSTILTGLLAFLSYDNFKAKHYFRGWLWSGLAAFFYAGNIYGSAASAQIFNAKINFDFTTELDLYIKNINYFIPEDEFKCK